MKAAIGFAAVKNGLLNLLYPARCPWCGNVVGFGACESCDGALREILLDGENLDLPARGEGGIEEAYACYRYEYPARDGLLRLKFEGQRGGVAVFGGRMAKTFVFCKMAGRYGCIVPVPVSPGTMRRRGYNQSALLAEELAKRVGVPLETGVLEKSMETEQQMLLDREARLQNVKGAYRVAGSEKIAGKRVLLVDDVATTGSTLNECAATLKAAGAVQVDALCLCAAGHRPTNIRPTGIRSLQ